jgi:hypothetical protein
MNVNELSLEQLKALAYDQLVAIQVAQNNLRLIEEAIAKKVQETQNHGDEVI